MNAPTLSPPAPRLDPSPPTVSVPLVSPLASRILVIDDDRARSYHLWASLGGAHDNGRVLTTENADAARSLIARHTPAIVLLAVDLADDNALELCDQLTRGLTPATVLLYRDHIDPFLAGSAIIAGAAGTFAAWISSEQVSDTVTAALAGEARAATVAPDYFSDIVPLVDDRDRPLVALLLAGTHPDEIAGFLGISGHALRLRHQAVIARLSTALAARSPGHDARADRPRR